MGRSVHDGPPLASQIVNLERMLEERDAEIERLKAAISEIRQADRLCQWTRKDGARCSRRAALIRGRRIIRDGLMVCSWHRGES